MVDQAKYKLKFKNDEEHKLLEKLFKETHDRIEAHKQSKYSEHYQLGHNLA